MAGENPKEQHAKFVLDLITTIRKGALYSSNHPVVLTSVESVYTQLNDILKNKESFHLNVSSDGRMLVDGEAVLEGKDSVVAGVYPFLKKWQVEDVTFFPGITAQDILNFIVILLWDDGRISAAGGDISGVVTDAGIGHIQLNQFSYLRVRKDQEVRLDEKTDIPGPSPAEGTGKAAETPAGGAEGESKAAVSAEAESPLDALKERIKTLFRQKPVPVQELESTGKEIFIILIGEYKNQKKISIQSRNVLTRFLVQSGDPSGLMVKLKSSMLDAGITAREVDDFARKIGEAVVRKQESGKKVPAAEVDALKSENEQLKTENNRSREQLRKAEELLGQLQKHAELINDERQKLDSVVHNMSDGMIVVDPEGKIIMTNPTAETLLGVTKDDIGRPLKDVIKNEHLLALVKGASSAPGDVELFSPDDSTMRVLRASSAMVEDQKGKTVGMVAILNDITKQKEIEGLKQEFLAKVTHELRTPLIAMEKSIGLLSSGAAGSLSGEQANFLGLTDRNLKRLSALINDLLDLSKIEAGKMSISRQPASIQTIIAESANVLQTWAQTKSLSIEQRVPEGLPQVDMDADRIIQVLHNLIGNAVKFTPENGVITISAGMNESGCLQVSVKDTGVGLSADELSKVFDKFYQVRGGLTNDIRGTGIGLAIAREIVQLHGGSIWAQSEPGKGAIFTFTIPPREAAVPPG